MSIHQTWHNSRSADVNDLRVWRKRALDAESRVAQAMEAERANGFRDGAEHGYREAIDAVSAQLRELAGQYRGNPVLEALAGEIDRVASDALKVESLTAEKPVTTTTISEIIDRVSDETGISRAHILGPQRVAVFAAARHEAMRRAYATGKYSLTQIGGVFNRDHTSIHHGIRRATERLESDAS